MVAAALSVPKKFFFEVPGTPDFKQVGTFTTPGIEQILIDFVVPSGMTKILYQAVVACRIESKFIVLVNGALRGSGRTGAAQPSDSFNWLPGLPVESGNRVQLLFTARPNSPSCEVEAYLQASEIVS